MATLKTRLDKLEVGMVEALGAAVDRLIPVLTRAERQVLICAADAALGLGPPLDAETVALADRAAAKMLAEATDAERRLLLAVLPGGGVTEWPKK